jgi:hypothetical protein
MNYACADALIGFLDALRSLTPGSAESFLVDTQFASFAIFIDDCFHLSYTRLRAELVNSWRTPDCLRALSRPLKQQKLAAAVSLACLCDEGNEFRRLIAANDHLEVLSQAVVDLTGSLPLDKACAGDFQAWRGKAVRRSVVWLAEDLRLNDPAAGGDDAMVAEPAAKRARTTGGAMLRASDVNVQRRDSTVLLIAGRPFYVFGALIETKSAVLADALSSATTLDPVAIALPNERGA